MLERIIVIGSATALAAVVLFFTLQSAPSDPQTARRSIDDPVDVELIPPFDPDRRTTRLDPRGQAKKYRINSVNSKGQLVELFGDRVTPLPEGVTRIESPGARVHLEPTRVLEIRAKEGTILAPDNQVRSGDFSGKVRLTLYEGVTQRAEELSPWSPEAKLHIYMRDADFDMELGQIETDYDVHVTGERVDFRGTGLSVIYNELRRRIDRLEITKGQSLRFKPDQQPVSTAGAVASTPDTTPWPVVEGDEDKPIVLTEGDAQDEAGSGEATAEIAAGPVVGQEEVAGVNPEAFQAADQEPVQYYRARFEGGVTIRSRNATIEADRLEVVFSLRDIESSGDNPERSVGVGAMRWPSDRPFVAGGGGGGLIGAGPRWLQAALVPLVMGVVDRGQTQLEEDTLGDTRTLWSDSDDAVTILWSGRLLVEPEDSPPIEIEGGDDRLIELVGSPVRITTAQGEVIVAASVDYLASQGRVRMFGSDRQRIKIDSPGFGVLEAKRLVINQDQGTGQISGSGSLRLRDGSRVDGDAGIVDIDGGHPTALSRQTVVLWEDRVDLSFYRAGPSPDAAASGAGTALGGGKRVDALKQAFFHGAVRVEHPQFELESDALTVGLSAATAGKQTIDQLEASQGVLVSSIGDASGKDVSVRCDRLEVVMADDGSGGIRPTRLIARGDVKASEARRVMRAGHLEIAMGVKEQESGSAADVADPVKQAGVETTTVAADQDAPAVATPADVESGEELEKPQERDELLLADSGPDDSTPLGQAVPVETGAAAAGDKQPRSFAHAWQGDTQEPSEQPNADQEHQDALVTQEAEPQAPAGHAQQAVDAEQGPTAKEQRYTVRSVFARDDVRVRLDDLKIMMTADRLVADMAADQMELFGLADRPARIERLDGALAGNHIVLNQAGQSAHVLGPGTITFFSQAAPVPGMGEAIAGQDSNDPTEPAPAEKTDSAVRVTVNWQQAMHFDNRYGLGQFVGQVVSEAWTDREMAQLSAQDLRIEFSELPQSDSGFSQWEPPQESEEAVLLGADQANPLTRQGRTVRMVTARDDVVFLASKWSGPAGDRLESRLKVIGPLISFDNLMEQIQVIGPGRLLLEDYRPRSQRRKHDPSSASLFGVERTGTVKFTGRGATLLRWKGQLMLDMFHNDLLTDTGVQMVHRSLDSQLTVQMDCRRLLADLRATGGLGVWFAGQTPQPQLQAVYADDAVRVVSDERTILTDHLEYTAFDQTILLNADEGKATEIQQEGQPTAVRAQRFRWNLIDNELEIIKPVVGRVPVQ